MKQKIKKSKISLYYPRKVSSRREQTWIYYEKKVEGQDIIVLRDRKIVYKYGFKRKDILEILIAMGKGIETLHSKANIFIGDLNGGNVLFDKNKMYISLILMEWE